MRGRRRNKEGEGGRELDRYTHVYIHVSLKITALKLNFNVGLSILVPRLSHSSYINLGRRINVCLRGRAGNEAGICNNKGVEHPL